MSLSHRGACNKVAQYMMTRLTWCDLAVVEIQGRAIDRYKPKRPSRAGLGEAAWSDYREAYEKWETGPLGGGGILDVMALTLPDWKPKKRKPRIAAVEVKVGRGDLLGDLRKSKMLRYEPQATHVYLAITDQAMLKPWSTYPPVKDEWLADLAAKGLPDHWGVIRIPEVWEVHALRQPKTNPFACDPTDELTQRLAFRSAVSMAHRRSREK